MGKSEKRTGSVENIKYGLTLILAAVMAFFPYFRGGYFNKEISVFQVIVSVIFILWAGLKIYKRERLALHTNLIYAVLLMTVVYVLPLLFGLAVNKYGAFDYIMRYLTGLGVFLIFSDTIRDKKKLVPILQIMAAGGVIAALFCLDSALGGNISNALSVVGGESDGERVFGIMQYANASGAYFCVISFVLILLGTMTENKNLKAMYGWLGTPVVLALLFTLSRGSMLVFAIVYIIVFVLAGDKKYRIQMVLGYVPSFLISLITFLPVYKIMQEIFGQAEYSPLRSRGLLILLAAIVVSFVVHFIVYRLQEKLEQVSGSVYKKVLVVLLLVVVIAGGAMYLSGVYKTVLPEFIVERLTISADASETTSGRWDMYKDAVSAIGDHMVFGAGGGSWNSIYRIYQRSLYDSAEPHNYVLQVWLDSGTIGLIALVFLAVTLVITILKNRKKESGGFYMLVSAIALMLLGHSIVDFDFSYLTMFLYFFLFLGVLDGFSTKTLRKGEEIVSLGGNFVALAAALVIAFNSIMSVAARSSAVKANQLFLNGTLTQSSSVSASQLLDSINSMQSAAQTDRWNTRYRVADIATDRKIKYDLSEICSIAESIVKGDSEEVRKLQEQIYAVHIMAVQEAEQLDPYNPIVLVKAASFYIGVVGDYDRGLQVLEKVVAYNPMGQARYEELCQGYLSVAEYYLEQGEAEKARPLLERIDRVEEEVALFNEQEARETVELNETTKDYINTAREHLKTI